MVGLPVRGVSGVCMFRFRMLRASHGRMNGRAGGHTPASGVQPGRVLASWRGRPVEATVGHRFCLLGQATLAS